MKENEAPYPPIGCSWWCAIMALAAFRSSPIHTSARITPKSEHLIRIAL
jgi:hypothetical protein